MSGAILLTGGTGFLGMELLARLLAAGDGPDVFVAVRARDAAQADQRVREVFSRLYETVPASAERVRPLAADLEAPGLGIGDAQRAELAQHVGRVVHCAASVAFTLPVDEARAINVDGTRRMLELARTLPKLERFVHVSTAYVSGRESGVFTEADAGGSGFRNTYESSKAEAEVVVAAARDVPSVVVRPSIVVGESDSGWTSAFNVLYWPMQAFARGIMKDVPADPAGIVDTVPVDYVAAVLERATFAPEVAGRIHAVAGRSALTVEELVEEASHAFGRQPPKLIPADTFPPDHPAGIFVPYFDVATSFDDTQARRLMGDDNPTPDPVDYLPRVIDYAQTARWGKRPMSREAAQARVAQNASTRQPRAA